MTRDLRRWDGVWRCWSAAVGLFELLALLLVGRRFAVSKIIFFPFAEALRRWCSWRTFVPVACSSFSSGQRRSWGWGTTCDATAG